MGECGGHLTLRAAVHQPAAGPRTAVAFDRPVTASTAGISKKCYPSDTEKGNNNVSDVSTWCFGGVATFHRCFRVVDVAGAGGRLTMTQRYA